MEGVFYYLISINIAAFVVYGLDKLWAKLRSWRVPELWLLALAAAGGSVGAYLAMQLFRHKTLHWKFRLGVPLLFVVQAALGMCLR
ncbi:MAG: DUF1294 domain-containing protein [Phascolarctobacterium sp.]